MMTNVLHCCAVQDTAASLRQLLTPAFKLIKVKLEIRCFSCTSHIQGLHGNMSVVATMLDVHIQSISIITQSSSGQRCF